MKKGIFGDFSGFKLGLCLVGLDSGLAIPDWTFLGPPQPDVCTGLGTSRGWPWPRSSGRGPTLLVEALDRREAMHTGVAAQRDWEGTKET